MKKYLLLSFFILLNLVLSAQQKPSFVGLSAGASIPVGKFHGTELDDGGFAITGFNISLEGAWFFKSWLGAGAYAGLDLHPVDITSLGDAKMQADPFIYSVYIRSDPYRTVSLYGGLYFHYPLVQRLSLTAKALGGIVYAETPYQLYKVDYGLVGIQWAEVTAAGDYEASFLAGAGLRYDLKNCIGFVLNSEFTYNTMDFSFYTINGDIRNDTKVMAFVNLSAGVVIKI
jgi:hypothetical protein